MLKLSRIRKASKTASSALASGRAEAVRAMARTKREGGVKSPGKPIKPEPYKDASEGDHGGESAMEFFIAYDNAVE